MDGIDGLISHENEEVRDRVAGLEKRVEKQEDEIVCLKSALSDVIRRLSSLESAKGNCHCPCHRGTSPSLYTYNKNALSKSKSRSLSSLHPGKLSPTDKARQQLSTAERYRVHTSWGEQLHKSQCVPTKSRVTKTESELSMIAPATSAYNQQQYGSSAVAFGSTYPTRAQSMETLSHLQRSHSSDRVDPVLAMKIEQEKMRKFESRPAGKLSGNCAGKIKQQKRRTSLTKLHRTAADRHRTMNQAEGKTSASDALYPSPPPIIRPDSISSVQSQPKPIPTRSANSAFQEYSSSTSNNRNVENRNIITESTVTTVHTEHTATDTFADLMAIDDAQLADKKGSSRKVEESKSRIVDNKGGSTGMKIEASKSRAVESAVNPAKKVVDNAAPVVLKDEPIKEQPISISKKPMVEAKPAFPVDEKEKIAPLQEDQVSASDKPWHPASVEESEFVNSLRSPMNQKRVVKTTTTTSSTPIRKVQRSEETTTTTSSSPVRRVHRTEVTRVTQKTTNKSGSKQDAVDEKPKSIRGRKALPPTAEKVEPKQTQATHRTLPQTPIVAQTEKRVESAPVRTSDGDKNVNDIERYLKSKQEVIETTHKKVTNTSSSKDESQIKPRTQRAVRSSPTRGSPTREHQTKAQTQRTVRTSQTKDDQIKPVSQHPVRSAPGQQTRVQRIVKTSSVTEEQEPVRASTVRSMETVPSSPGLNRKETYTKRRAEPVRSSQTHTSTTHQSPAGRTEHIIRKEHNITKRTTRVQWAEDEVNDKKKGDSERSNYGDEVEEPIAMIATEQVQSSPNDKTKPKRQGTYDIDQPLTLTETRPVHSQPKIDRSNEINENVMLRSTTRRESRERRTDIEEPLTLIETRPVHSQPKVDRSHEINENVMSRDLNRRYSRETRYDSLDDDNKSISDVYDENKPRNEVEEGIVMASSRRVQSAPKNWGELEDDDKDGKGQEDNLNDEGLLTRIIESETINEFIDETEYDDRSRYKSDNGSGAGRPRGRSDSNDGRRPSQDDRPKYIDDGSGGGRPGGRSDANDGGRRPSQADKRNGAQQQNNILPSKSPIKTTAVTRKPSHANSPVNNTRRAASSDYITPPVRHTSSPQPSNKGSPRGSASSSKEHTPSKRYSTSALPSENGHTPRRSRSMFNLLTPVRPLSHSFCGAKDPIYNKEDGNLRIFLKGRPVTTYAPSDIQESYDLAKVGQIPSEKLKLEWVYGYRGRDCRNNIFFLPTGEIVYFVAAVVVLYNVEEQMQRHYLGHNDDVKALAVHPDKITIATGQVAGHDRSQGKPHVRVWDSVSLNTLHIIGLGEIERGVACLSFSKADGGQYLCVIDESNEHILSLWDWSKSEKGHKLTETKSSQEPVLAAEFHPFEKNQIITCGKSTITFWTLEGGSLSKKNGIFEKYEKPKYVLCLCFAENGDVLTGDSNGNVFVWGKGSNKIQHAILNAHEGGIFSLCVLKNGTLLSGGGKDRKIIQWDTNYQRLGPATELPEQYGPVRTLSQGRGNMVLVGTTRNSILQGTLDLEFSPIVQGHMDELWGLAVHPNQHQFITGGYDKGVYFWDALTHSSIWFKEINDAAHCGCFYPDGEIVAVGTQTGRWIILDTTSREILAVHTDGNEQIECMEYSPDGKYLALGSRDNYIYVYQTTEGGRKYSRIGKCVGHSSFVTHLDWSEDSQYLMSNSGDYEVLFWTAGNCSMYTSPASLRDVKFATQNCTLCFNTMGIWPEGADGTDVNGCCRNSQRTLVASADDFGKVNLYNYPSIQPRSAGHTYGGHSSHVTAVRFLYDDSRLLSTGGKDTAVMQWEIV